MRPLLLGGLGGARWCVTALGSVALIACFRPPPAIAVALASGSMLVGLIWVVLAFCGAVRDYSGVTLSFLVRPAGLDGRQHLGARSSAAGAAGMTWGFLPGWRSRSSA